MSDATQNLVWTRPMLEQFKKAIAQAKASGKGRNATFWFSDVEFVIAYAEYLVEYLETKL